MKAPLKVAILKGLQNAMDTTWQKFFNKVAVLDENNAFTGDNTHSGTETFSGSVAGTAFDGSGEIVPTSGNGWTSGTGCFYCKTFDGYVVVHMFCEGSGIDTGGTTLFTLPAGYRPNNPFHAPLIANVGGWSSSGLFFITTSGDVQIYGVAGTGPTKIAGNAIFKAA